MLMKDSRKSINFSQRRRGWIFQKTTGKHAGEMRAADAKTFVFGETKLRFSEPVFHGLEDSLLGWILMILVESRGEKVLFAPDVQGPMVATTLEMILGERLDLLIIGGPPLYLVDFRVEEADIKRGVENLARIVSKVPEVILEHHLLRDAGWLECASPLFDTAERTRHKLMTAAEYAGSPNNLLECRRRELYENEPPSREFKKWMRLSMDERGKTKPPIT